jgi:hypothetical protein
MLYSLAQPSHTSQYSIEAAQNVDAFKLFIRDSAFAKRIYVGIWKLISSQLLAV